MGILRTAELAVTLSFAAPAAYLGVTTLLEGNQMGWVFLALAALLVGVNTLVDTPADLVEAKLASTVGRIAKDPDD